jgi:predicted nucleotidyltransferase
MNSPQASVDPAVYRLAQEIATEFSTLAPVESVWLGGSHASGQANATSDIDLYIYTYEELPAEVRASIIEPRASVAEVGYNFWEVEDYWRERKSGTKVEAMYRRPEWETQHLEDLFANNRARMGFSTAGWTGIVKAHVLFDRYGWAREVKALADRPYPEELTRAIIHLNLGVLRGTLVTHPEALTSALARDDFVFGHSRINEILNCYFDILFALNRTLHPGAKRQLADAQTLPLKPEGIADDVTDLLQNSRLGEMPEKVEALIGKLETLLKKVYLLQ